MGSTDGGNGATTDNQFGYVPAAAVEASGISPNFTALFTVSSGRQSQYVSEGTPKISLSHCS